MGRGEGIYLNTTRNGLQLWMYHGAITTFSEKSRLVLKDFSLMQKPTTNYEGNQLFFPVPSGDYDKISGLILEVTYIDWGASGLVQSL